jgi:hypothetical protein
MILAATGCAGKDGAVSPTATGVPSTAPPLNSLATSSEAPDPATSVETPETPTEEPTPLGVLVLFWFGKVQPVMNAIGPIATQVLKTTMLQAAGIDTAPPNCAALAAQVHKLEQLPPPSDPEIEAAWGRVMDDLTTAVRACQTKDHVNVAANLGGLIDDMQAFSQLIDARFGNG